MNSIVFLPLSQSKVAVIDFDDMERVGRVKWCAQRVLSGKFYAVRSVQEPNGAERREYLSRAVVEAPKGMDVDHKDGDTLNNQKSNLRVCSRRENSRNRRKQKPAASSKFKGVFRGGNCYKAQIKIGLTQTHLGYFKFDHEAAEAYDTAARKHFGEFACCNFPLTKPQQESQD
jgi:hypothetical protein